MDKEALYKKIYNDLLDDILSNKYPPGSCLPSEFKISELYGVSRITSKKALEMLAEQKLIVRKPGKGSFVIGNESDGQEPANKVHQENKTIGVLFDSFGSNFGSDILLGIEKRCNKYGFDMVLKCSHGKKEKETSAIKRFLEMDVSGMIIMCVHDDIYNDEILKLSLKKFPMVLIDRQLKGIPIPFVGTDNYKASRVLTNYLFDLGHTNICYAAPLSNDTSTLLERHKGFIDCHLERGVITNEGNRIANLVSTLPSYWDFDEKKEDLIRRDVDMVKAYMAENPKTTAYFAVEYGIAKIIYEAMKELNTEKEKVIVCFDGIADCNLSAQFAYVAQEQYVIGKTSVDILNEVMNGNHVPETTLIPYQIITYHQP
ncbi:DNA-binding LacI/PurR family transcriptional regulator [Anaerotaenia torta]|uniref:GntR family transcriptional regulator n=1 Tax=Anaerotaenia torta TaxID=433293 RepID=UPI003D1F9B20